MGTRISLTGARLDDPAALREFLSGIPNGDQLGNILARRDSFTSRAYEDETETARFVGSDGIHVKCFAVTDITIDQAEMIAAINMDVVASDESTFREGVKLALGPTYEPGW